jgi:hypothetical protein
LNKIEGFLKVEVLGFPEGKVQEANSHLDNQSAKEIAVIFDFQKYIEFSYKYCTLQK